MKKALLCLVLVVSMILPLAAVSSAYSVTGKELYLTVSDNPSIDFDISAYKSNGSYYIFLPNTADSENAVIRYNMSVSSVSGADWNRSAKTITAHGEGRFSVNGTTVYVMQSSLPSFSISLDSGASMDTIHNDKEAKINVHADINGAGEYDASDLAGKLKTRGNSTWLFIKKPYQISFNSKTDLFGMGKAKKWVLLANYVDGTMVKNQLIFDLGREIGMPYIVESVFVDLYVDGQYYGVYQLCEKVEIGSSRVDITSDEGIIIEMDGANRDLSGEIYFKTETTGKPIVYKEYNTDFEETEDPETVAKVKEIRTFTENYINTLEKELYSADPSWEVISSMIDVDSFINYYFITEFSNEYDATYASTFFYMDGKDDVLHCGPLWDYDRIFGCNPGDERGTDSDFLKNIIDASEVTRVEWFKQLFRHPEFVKRANEIYEETIKPAFETEKVLAMVDKYQEMLLPSLRMNHVKFVVFYNINHTVDEFFSGTTDEYLAYTTDHMKTWITERNAYLETAYGKDHPALLYRAHYNGAPAEEYSGGSMTYDLGSIGSFSARLENSVFDGGIEYSAYSGTTKYEYAADGAPLIAPEGKTAITGLMVRLTGNVANYFDVQYRVYRNGSWSDWKLNGDNAGAKRGTTYITRVQVRLLEKKDLAYSTLSLDTAGTIALDALSLIPGNKYTLPADISNEEYIFGGWYDNAALEGEAITEIVAPEVDSTLYAKLTRRYEKGDTNCDGKVNTQDLFRIKLIALFIVEPDESERNSADVNGDGLINSADIFLLTYRILHGQTADTDPVIPDRTEPEAVDFTIYDGNGNEVHLFDFAGKPVILNFWASWCVPCKKEMPDFNEKYLEYGDEIQFLMIDFAKDDKIEDAKKYVADMGFKFPIYFDVYGDASSAYKVDAFPTTVFIDADGYIMDRYLGTISEETLQSGIDKILK